VVQDEAAIRLVRVLVEMVDAVRVEQGRAPLDAVYLIALLQQQLREIGPVLSGHAGDQCLLHEINFRL